MDKGLIVDLETTGLDAKVDKIIEIGIVEFGISEGFTPHFLSSYSELEDPGCQLDENIKNITGITNEMLRSKFIDWNKVVDLFTSASIVIAHNMDFDRSFLLNVEKIKNLDIHWGCSLKHIDWNKHGFKSASLNYLAADHGFINPFAHRAVFDCATTYRLISPYLKELIDKSFQKEVKIIACNAPYKMREHLKNKGYRWDPNDRVWYKVAFENNLEEEREFLQEKIYDGRSLHKEMAV